MIYVGIDPGINGAVGFVADRASYPPRVHDLPRHAVEHRLDGFGLARILRENIPADESAIVWIEQVHAIANHSDTKGGASMQTMGSMMRSVGIITGAVDCCRLSMIGVVPRVWKRFYRLDKDKHKSLDMARRIFSGCAPHDLRLVKHADRAEALLIAHFARQTMSGQREHEPETDEVPF